MPRVTNRSQTVIVCQLWRRIEVYYMCMCKHLVSSANRYGMAEDTTSGISYIRQREVGPEYFPGEHQKQQGVDQTSST